VAAVTSYRVVYERDEDGYWVADIPELVGAHTQGRTIPTTRARIREVIALVERIDDEYAFGLQEEFVFPESTAEAVVSALEKRQAAEQAQVDAIVETERGAKLLIESKVSMRDAGEILGISSGRIQQLVKKSTLRGGAVAHTAGTDTITVTGMKDGIVKTVIVPFGSTLEDRIAAPGRTRTATSSRAVTKAEVARRSSKTNPRRKKSAR
jgi:predicted RNase H-like HicB family nuclease